MVISDNNYVTCDSYSSSGTSYSEFAIVATKKPDGNWQCIITRRVTAPFEPSVDPSPEPTPEPTKTTTKKKNHNWWWWNHSGRNSRGNKKKKKTEKDVKKKQ